VEDSGQSVSHLAAGHVRHTGQHCAIGACWPEFLAGCEHGARGPDRFAFDLVARGHYIRPGSAQRHGRGIGASSDRLQRNVARHAVRSPHVGSKTAEGLGSAIVSNDFRPNVQLAADSVCFESNVRVIREARNISGQLGHQARSAGP
jgi:hypothetical protein